MTLHTRFLAGFMMLCCGLGSPLWGIGQDIPQPLRCILQLDKAFYASGEVIWYQLYLPKALQGQPCALRLQLHQPAAGRPLADYYLQSGGQTEVSGYISLPFDAPSAVYQLSVEAFNVAKKQRESLLAAWVPIYNDLEPPAQADAIPAPVPGQIPPPDAALALAWGNLPNHVKPGQRVQTQLTVTQPNTGTPVADAHLAVSVTDMGLAGPTALNWPHIHTGPALSAVQLAQLGKEIFVSGRLLDTLGAPLASGLLGAVGLADQRIHFTKSDADGRFVLDLPDFSGPRSLRFISLEHPVIRIALDGPLSVAEAPQLPVTPGVLHYLASSRQRKKIYQLYGALEYELQPTATAPTRRVSEPDKTLVFADYVSFPDLATFFQEVAQTLWFSRQRGAYQARFYNPALRANFPGNPLFLLDGQPTYDVNYVASLNPARLARVELFYSPRNLREMFPGFGANGVVNIVSLENNLSLPPAEQPTILTIQGLLPTAAFPAYGPATDASATPRLRPLLHWQTDLRTDQEGRAQLDYWQSDDRSTFKIEVWARSPSGEWGVAETTYQTGGMPNGDQR